MEEPYVGLGHFTEEYADRFFGRDTECSLIIGNLRAARLTLLYAESGVGKSSVLRAGVVARLHGFADNDLRGRGRPRLVPVVFSSWSEAPVAALVLAVGDAVRPYLVDDASLELPDDDLERALELASAALDTTLLVVLDQFEEYFLYPDEQSESKRVADQIARCVNRADLRANFLISIREDSYARLGDLFRGKVTNVYANFLHLDFLDRDGAREAIEKPLERVNELQGDGQPYELDPPLVDAVLDQVGRGRMEAADADGHRDGSEARDEVETTYLQLVMRRLWGEETAAGSHRLRLRTLEDLGGAQAVITSHLDRAMDDEADGASLTDAQRLVAASIFHFLVTSGGTKIALTAKDLSDLSGRPLAEIDPVLQHLSSPALHILRPVVSENGQGEPRFEIFHDALARPIVEWRTRVEEAELGKRLERERAEKEKAQQAAAEAEEREVVERRRKRGALALLGIVVVVLVIGIFVALIRQEHVSEQRKAANQSVRAAERMSELAESPTFGPAATALASIEAYHLSPTDEARNLSLAELQLNPGLPAIAVGHTRSANTVAYWPDSSGFVTGGNDGTVRLWHADGREIAPPIVNSGGGAESVAAPESADGIRLLAAGFSDGSLGLWRLDRSGGLRLRRRLFSIRSGSVQALAVNPRNLTLLAAGGSNGRITLWDLADSEKPSQIGSRRTAGSVSDLTFTANGRGLLVAGGRAGQEWKVSRAGFAPSAPRMLVPGGTRSVAAAPNGSYAFASHKGIHVWDAERLRERYLGAVGRANSLAFARGGSVLVSAGTDLNVVTWEVASGRLFGPPRLAGGEVNDVAVSPDGRTIAAAADDGLVKLWPVVPHRTLARTVASLSSRELGPRPPEVQGLAVLDDGIVAVAGGQAGTSLWRLDAATDTAPQPLARVPGRTFAVAAHDDLLAIARGRSFVLEDTGPGCDTMPAEPCQLAVPAAPHSDRRVVSLAFGEYGSRLLLASSGHRESGVAGVGLGLINLWDVTDTAETGEVTHLSTRHKYTEIIQVALSPASPLLVAGTRDGKLRVWDVSDPSRPDGITIPHARGNEDQPVHAVAFSPNGKLLASGGGDQQVVLWKVIPSDSGPPRIEATPGTLFLTQTVFALAFSDDGKTLAVGDGNGLTSLYRVATRDQVGTYLVGHVAPAAAIDSVAFTTGKGGRPALLTAGLGQPIVAWDHVLWNLDGEGDRVEKAIGAAVCALAGRNLTADEWSAIFGSTTIADDLHKTCDQYPLLKETE
jgi:WD40 repeat protein